MMMTPGLGTALTYEEWIKHVPNKPSQLLKIWVKVFDGKVWASDLYVAGWS